MRRRQRRDGSKLAVFLRSSSIGPKSSARSGRIRRRWAFAIRHPAVAAVALGHVAFGGIVLRRAVRAGHVAVATADADILVHHHKTVVALVHCPARADLGAGRIFAVVAGNRQVIGEDILMPDAVILLPVAARVFINTPEADLRGQVFVILAGQLAGFAPGAAAGIKKNPYWVVIGYPYAFST